MVNQKPISMRIDERILAQVDQEAFTSGTPRNRILNKGAALYVELQDLRRRLRYYDGKDSEALLEQFFRRFVPELAKENRPGGYTSQIDL